MTFKWQDHIVRDPHICGGLPTMKGTRVLLRQVLADVANGTAAVIDLTLKDHVVLFALLDDRATAAADRLLPTWCRPLTPSRTGALPSGVVNV